MGAARFFREGCTLYDNIVWELRKEIMKLGLTMQECDDLAGVQEGYTAKCLHPDTASGRQAKWDTLEMLIRAVFKGDYRLKIRSQKRMLSGLSTIEKAKTRGDIGRLAIRDFSWFAGQRGGIARTQSQSPSQRSKQARRAARARWSKPAAVPSIAK